MSVLNLLLKIQRKVVPNTTAFSLDLNRDKEVLWKFGEPRDDIERSFFQYKCQMRGRKWYVRVSIQFVSLIMLIYYVVLKRKNKKEQHKQKKIDAIFLSELKNTIVPEELKSEYHMLQLTNYRQCGTYVGFDDMIVKEMFRRYPFSFYFLFKCWAKIMIYQDVINLYSPKAIICSAEYSFTSSILTKYCEEKHVVHINVMHGEKLFLIRDSFFRFSKCYIWDEYYKQLFIKLRADADQFCVAVPKSLLFDSAGIEKDQKRRYTYYLGGETETEVKVILTTLRKLANPSEIVLRPHPLYIDSLKSVRESGFFIENPFEITIEESISNTNAAISLYSTVLQQAYFNNTEVIIDDVSFPQNYKKLQELEYIMLGKKHKLLSELIQTRI